MQPEVLPQSLGGAPPQQWIAAPSPVYLTGEEFLRLSTLANLAGVTLTVTGRILRPDNTISRLAFTHAPNSNRTIATTIVGLPEGWLLGLTIRATGGSPAFGQVWANLELGISSGATFTVDQTLGYGFLTANTPYQWPNGVNLLPLDGPGNLRSITGSTPGAGVEISETVPTSARWELLSFRTLLVVAAGGSARVPNLTVTDGTNEVFRASVAGTIPAGFGNTFIAGYPGGTWAGGVPSRAYPVGTPNGLRLGAGYKITTVTDNLAAGDQFSAVQYLVREWMVGE